jgi:homocysteine S-methyltransferase
VADLLAALDAGILLGDGAMGTELFRRGVPRDHCLPELNLSRPDLVAAVHEDYARAGARVHRTNTFTANRVRLEPFGLADKVREINQAAVAIARKAAGPDGFVAGSVGPMPEDGATPFGYTEQMWELVQAGCDLVLLETFTTRQQVESALVGLGFPGALSAAADEALEEIRTREVSVVGVNCVAAPTAARMLSGLSGRRMAFPSPGLPGQVAAPEEFARACEPLLDLGVRILGGCCGAGPEHIRALGAILRRPRPSA